MQNRCYAAFLLLGAEAVAGDAIGRIVLPEGELHAGEFQFESNERCGAGVHLWRNGRRTHVFCKYHKDGTVTKTEVVVTKGKISIPMTEMGTIKVLV